MKENNVSNKLDLFSEYKLALENDDNKKMNQIKEELKNIYNVDVLDIEKISYNIFIQKFYDNNIEHEYKLFVIIN